MVFKFVADDLDMAREYIYYMSLMGRKLFYDALSQYVNYYLFKDVNKTDRDYCKFPNYDCMMCPICNECPLALDDEVGEEFWEY